jgi:hypothetical protein
MTTKVAVRRQMVNILRREKLKSHHYFMTYFTNSASNSWYMNTHWHMVKMFVNNELEGIGKGPAID